jgi:PAS domain S-box-containing protein
MHEDQPRQASCTIRATESHLLKKAELVARIMETSPAGITVVDRQGQIIFANASAESILGLTRSQITQRSYNDPAWRITDYDGQPFPDEELPFCRVMAEGTPVSGVRHAIEFPDGRRTLLLINAAPLLDDGGQVDGMVANVEDVTEQVRVESAVRESEKQYRALVEQSLQGLAIVSRHGIVFANQTLAEMTGYSVEHLVSLGVRQIGDLLHPDNRQQVLGRLADRLADKPVPARYEIKIVHRSGETRVLDLHSTRIIYDGKPAVQAALVDCTERARAEAALRESELRLRVAMESLPFDFFALDTEERYILQNSVCRHHWGDIVGKRPQDLEIDEQTLALWHSNNRRALAGEVVSGEVTFSIHGEQRHIHNVISPIHDEGQILGILGVNIDITERRSAQRAKIEIERQLLHAQKMEAVGTLAGGLAHDLNNLLTGILGRAELLKLDTGPDSRVHQSAEVIETAALRATEITRQLLGFAREGKIKNVPVALVQLIEEAISILEHTLDKRIGIITSFEIEQPVVYGDPGQLEQVLLNLAVNARDAMPEGGRLMVEVAAARPEPDRVRAAGCDDTAHYLLIRISDTGCGIKKEIQGRIFEPFFTTKEQGQGTGMGLAMVYGIVENHGGWIEVDSEPGRGSVFSVYLPLSEDFEPQVTEPLPDTISPPEGANILVVDDDEVVLETISGMLSELGYSVRCAENGRDAVAIYHRHGEEIDLVLLDMIMPVMNGAACYRALRELNPEVRVLIVTGHAMDDVAGELAVEGGCDIITKPFLRATLSSAVARVLAS